MALNPPPGAFRLAGRQAIVWSPTSHAGTSREHVLRVPLQDITPVSSPATVGTRTALDGSAREVYTVGDPVHMVEATIRFDHAPESLIQMLAAGARGETLTYYPDVDHATGYSIKQVEPTGRQVARIAEVHGIFPEFDVTFRFRKADGTAFGPALFTGLLFSYTAGDDLSRATFSRASDATYKDIDEVRQTAASGVARDDHYVTDEDGEKVWSLKLEASRTNELFNSTSPATQTRNLTAGDYTLWIEGSGSVDASGATDGAYGTVTEGQANDLTFTVTVQQDVTFTVNGTVDVFQCEEGAFRSSLIETAGAGLTRSADSLSYDISGTPLATPQEVTVYCKHVERGTTLKGDNIPLFHIGSNTFAADPRLSLRSNSNNYGLVHDNGTTAVGSNAPGSDLTSTGAVVEHLGVLYSDGSVQLRRSVDGGTIDDAGRSGAASLAASWAADLIHLNGPQNIGFNDFIALKVASGVHTMDEMRRIAGEG